MDKMATTKPIGMIKTWHLTSFNEISMISMSPIFCPFTICMFVEDISSWQCLDFGSKIRPKNCVQSIGVGWAGDGAKQMEQPWSESCWGVNGGAAVSLFLIFWSGSCSESFFQDKWMIYFFSICCCCCCNFWDQSHPLHPQKHHWKMGPYQLQIGVMSPTNGLTNGYLGLQPV